MSFEQFQKMLAQSKRESAPAPAPASALPVMPPKQETPNVIAPQVPQSEAPVSPARNHNSFAALLAKSGQPQVEQRGPESQNLPLPAPRVGSEAGTPGLPSQPIADSARLSAAPSLAAPTTPQAIESAIIDAMPETPVLKLGSQFAHMTAGIQPDAAQQAAINMLLTQKYANLIGAGGTGKTFCTKSFVLQLIDQIGTVDLARKREQSRRYAIEHGARESDLDNLEDADEVEAARLGTYMPSIALVAFTGKATENIKRQFPREWHPLIKTIHKLLEYTPVPVLKWDQKLGMEVPSMEFQPMRNQDNKIVEEVVIIDEGSMVAVGLWNNLWAALPERTRVICIGDINQLPPTHGRSIFGHMLNQWPVAELTKVYRQRMPDGSESVHPIIEQAHNILSGRIPQPVKGYIAWSPVKGDSAKDCIGIIRTLVGMQKAGVYDPYKDMVITAINGWEKDGRLPQGWQLGQGPLNHALVKYFNPGAARHMCDCGMGVHTDFAIGDRVMVTKNADFKDAKGFTRRITNGMTGVIKDMWWNDRYDGILTHSEDALLAHASSQPDDDFSGIKLEHVLSPKTDKADAESRKRAAGPCNWTIVVDFAGTIGEITFSTQGQVGTLQLAYVSTCHKVQGDEYPLAIVIAHPAHLKMLNREWLYTAHTRAKEKVMYFSNDFAIRAAMQKQRIKGRTLAEKLKVFQDLMEQESMWSSEDDRQPTYLPAPETIDFAIDNDSGTDEQE